MFLPILVPKGLGPKGLAESVLLQRRFCSETGSNRGAQDLSDLALSLPARLFATSWPASLEGWLWAASAGKSNRGKGGQHSHLQHFLPGLGCSLNLFQVRRCSRLFSSLLFMP